jgi:hypothetical protein
VSGRSQNRDRTTGVDPKATFMTTPADGRGDQKTDVRSGLLR